MKLRNKIFLSLSLLMVFGYTRSFAAETYAERSLLQKNELIPLQRITVGPNDHFQTAVSGDEKKIFYTSHTNLAVRIFVHELSSGNSSALMTERSDSKDPVISPDGKWLAYTGFEKDSRGDICIRALDSSSSRCLTDRETEDFSPFWISNDRLGYLSRKKAEEPWSLTLVSLDERNSKKTILDSGSFGSPTCSRTSNGSRWLAYTKVAQGRGSIELRELKSDGANFAFGESASFSPDLPGLSSFPRFDPSGEYLYFGQYTSDTNGDYEVDARDKSSVFRVRLKDILNKFEAFPEPLTSIDQNCNYPSPTATSLFVTCASANLQGDAALDIYRLPLTGIVPTHWDEEKMLRGIETSRTYSDRVLLHSALMARFRRYRKPETYEKVLSNHVMDGQLPSALFYAQKLKTMSQDPRFFELLELLLAAELRAKTEETSSASFQTFADAQIQKASRIRSAEKTWALIVEAYLRNLKQKGTVPAFDLKSIKSPLALYFAGQLLLREKSRQLEAFKVLASSQVLDEEARAYYAYEFLRAVERTYSPAERLSYLRKSLTALDKDSVLADLIQNDLGLESLKSDNIEDPENQKIYSALAKNLTATKARYFLYRAKIVRNVLSLSARGFWNYMQFFALRWVNAASMEDSEFAYARRQFLSTSLENAYGSFSNRKFSFAGDQFVNTAQLTDDLEAHHGFIRSRFIENRLRDIDEMYKTLQDNHYIRENMTYVSALLKVLKGGLDEKQSRSLLGELEKMPPGGFNPALRYALMGFLSEHIYLLQREVGDENADDFEKAHSYSMMALDLGQENERLVSALLMNLGVLHQAAGNHGQSLSFFELRKNHVFEDALERQSFLWYLARSHFFNFDYRSALSVMEQAIALEARPEFLERAGFYAAQAGLFDKAVKYYADFFTRGLTLDDEDLLRVKAGFGYALFKAGKMPEAKKYFREILDIKNLGQGLHRPGTRLPLMHYHLVALGFLARTESDVAEKIPILSDRLSRYRKSEGDLNNLLIKRDDWLREILAIQFQILELELLQRDLKAVPDRLTRIANDLESLLVETSNLLDAAQVGGLTNYLVTVRMLREKSVSFSKEAYQKVMKRAEELHKLIDKTPELKSAPEFASFEKWFQEEKKASQLF